MSRDDEPNRDADPSATALAWWVKCDAGPLSAADRVAFAAWLAADPAHRAAFDEAAHLFSEVQDLWTGGQVSARKRPARVAPVAALLAASLAAFLLFDELALRFRADVLTGTGETRVVELEDGSRAHLSARSALAIRYRAGERRLALLAGEAYFEAAPDPARPFVVEAAGATVTALGTAFDIALEDKSNAEVAVAEHRVAVASGGARAIVEEGRHSRFGAGAPITEPAPVDFFRIGGWRRGRLVFEDEPLADVLATLGRYHHGFLFAAPSVRGLLVTGSFDAANPIGAASALEAALGVKTLSISKYMIFIYK
ncbi:FecR family protein [Methylosinus sporium]|uniref:Iron dicitrate transport regulator FecR n=1 Tax=Methylosinus sporium TaxID=428 RepID=A0A2U1SPU8_METSR|nr:FecR domain-containing protein [Methylosinus sporium]PWB93638.1 iron dicitrate transport regulator FecR [Methylosinus sporium]